MGGTYSLSTPLLQDRLTSRGSKPKSHGNCTHTRLISICGTFWIIAMIPCLTMSLDILFPPGLAVQLEMEFT